MSNNFEIKRRILDKIKEYDRIVISRHIRPDGDAVGSTKGLAGMLRLSFPDKDIRVINSDYSDYVAFLGLEDTAEDDFYDGALAIILDTATPDRISNKKYALAREVIKIDHHIDKEPYGDIFWVEDGRSSVCEMIADFYLTFPDELRLDLEAATCIYTGMVTDSGRFRFRSVSGDTLRCAAALLDMGIDTDALFARLYLEDPDYLKFKAYVYLNMKMTEHGVAYIYVDKEMRERFSLSDEEAANTVSCLDSIKGSIIWVAFIDTDDGKIRVRLRSRFVTVNRLAEKYRGGGHDCASGATLYGADEIDALLGDADELIRDYKENNGGWL